jgi:two-component system, sensor histidine kinase and response regulator
VSFGDISIGRKLMALIMATSSAALVLACVSLLIYDQIASRRTSVEHLDTLANIIADNSTAAIAFGDVQAATEVLGALHAERHIVAASVYDKQGSPFASYRRDNAAGWKAPVLRPAGSYSEANRLMQFRPIELGGERIGAVYIESDAGEILERWKHYAIIVMSVMLVSWLAALAVAALLHRSISGPVLDLVEKAKQVSTDKDYSIRATPVGADEIGLLAQEFNEMLAEIQKRDEELHRHRAHLEHEVAARTAMNHELEKAKEASEAANRAKSEFLANMSHEIRTPMNGVLGMTELALETELTAEQRDYMSMVKSSAEGLLTIINDVLDFSKIEAGKLELNDIEFELEELIGSTLRVLAIRAHQKGLELVYDVDPTIPEMIVGDPDRLRQVIINLVGNAIKFTESGEIVFTAKLWERAKDKVRLRFDLRDTGIGIPKEKQKLIFEAFGQADASTTRKYGGTGLGLTISACIVQVMNGEIWVDSEPGVGTEFHFTADFKAALRQATSDEMRLRALTSKRALIVDDNSTSRTLLHTLLTRWEVSPTAVDGAEAALAVLEAASEQGSQYDFLLIDGDMPVMDGFELAQAVRGAPKFAGIIVMMLMAGGGPSETERCDGVEVDAYVVKPVRQRELRQVLLRLAGQDSRPAAVSSPSPEAMPKPERLRILVAEDNHVNRQLALRLLESAGHEVTLATNGREAVEACCAGNFDTILMDIQMPELDGLEATAEIRRQEQQTGKHVAIIAMTAHAMRGDRERCIAGGMDGYVGKPISRGELMAAIAQHVPGARLTSSAGAAHSSRVREDVRAAAGGEVQAEARALDAAAVLERVGGDKQLLGELCEIFVAELPRMMGTVSAALEGGDQALVYHAVHALKGAVGVFCAEAASRVICEMEDDARRGDLSLAARKFMALKIEMEKLEPDVASLSGRL